MKKLYLFLALIFLTCMVLPAAAAEDIPLKMTEVSFFDTAGNQLSKITDGSIRASATVFYDTLSRDNSNPKDGSLICVLYSGNRLKEINCLKKSFYAGNNQISLGQYNVENAENSCLKVMFWGSETSLSPLSRSETLSSKSLSDKIISFEVNGKKMDINHRRGIIWLETENGEELTDVSGVTVKTDSAASIEPAPSSLGKISDGQTFIVTAENGQTKTYTVKIEKALTLLSKAADFEGIELGDNGMPLNASGDLSDWNVSSVNYPSSSELVKEENGNTYFVLDSGNASNTSSFTFARRTWTPVSRDEMQKLSVSFKINVFGFYNSWTDADIQVGSQPYSYLMISNNRSLPSDGVVNTENELKKYFLRDRMTGSGRSKNILICDAGKWYEIKSVCHKYSDTSCLIETYVNGRMLYDTKEWAYSPAITKLYGGSEKSTLKTNFYAGNFDTNGWFSFFNWGNRCLKIGFDDIALSYAK